MLPWRIQEWGERGVGNHYNYFRDYHPAIGRYIQSDPIGLESGLSTFSYSDSSPQVWGDPLGLAAGAAGRIVIGLGGVAMQACMRISACRGAVEKARKVCKDVECNFKRERADHNFGSKASPIYCEHYRITCWVSRPNKQTVFSDQFPIPGRCFDSPRKNLYD